MQYFIYGIVEFPRVKEFAKKHNIPIYRIEDAFIRSVALGSGFAKPYSLSIDSKGVYFDPREESELEYMLQNSKISRRLLSRARAIRKEIVDSKLSKYNHLSHTKIEINRDRYKKVILVTGQVEDDMSIKYGAFGLNNRDLLEMVRKRNPDAFILYKPHPDVLSGNRKGRVPQSIISRCANRDNKCI